MKETAKLVLGIVTAFGVDEIVGNAIKSVNPTKMSNIKRICVGVASVAISGVICDRVGKYVDESIDKVFDFVEQFGNENNDKADAGEEES